MRVLLVEDSRVVRAYVEAILKTAPEVTLLPSAIDGQEALERAARDEPDVILMDLEIPRIDGLSCIRAIMESRPCPIVVLSAHIAGRADARTFEAFEAGAVDVMRKPEGLTPESIERFRDQLLRTLRAMASARVVRRGAKVTLPPQATRGRVRVVAIGGSTGAPPVIHSLLAHLRGAARIPLVIAQHNVAGFESSFAEWLATSGTPAVVATEGTLLRDGVATVLPSDRSLSFDGSTFVVRGRDSGATPNIDRLFSDLADAFGEGALGILLSGMGRDGASGALRVQAARGEVWTQLGASCVVNGIPAAARMLGASTRELDVPALAKELRNLVCAEHCH